MANEPKMLGSVARRCGAGGMTKATTGKRGSVGSWLRHELTSLLLATSYFAVCFLLAILLKHLVLEDYGIQFGSVATAFVAALVTAKVVIILGRVTITHRIGLLDIAERTILYTAAAFLVMLLEKAVSSREAAGGLVPAFRQILDHPEMPHVWANLIVVGFAFAGFAAFDVLRRRLGVDAISQAFLETPVRSTRGPG